MAIVQIQAPISVIIPVKNGARFLRAALESVLAQTVAPLEIFLIDGRSTDESVKIAESYDAIAILTQQDNGLANARNLGIERSVGEFIAFLDSDDIWSVDKLAVQWSLMQAQPRLRYSTTLLDFLVSDGERHAAAARPAGAGALDGATPGSLLARRDLFDEIGGFDPAYAIATDHDWFMRARDFKAATAVLPQVLLHKRLHRDNLSRDTATYRREMMQVMRRSVARKRAQNGAASGRQDRA